MGPRAVVPAAACMLAAGVIVIVGLLLLWGTPAAACDDHDDCSGGSADIIDGQEVEAHVFDWTSVRTGVAQRSPSSAPRCRYAELELEHYHAIEDHLQLGAIPAGALLYRVRCSPDGDTWRTRWYRPDDGTPGRGGFAQLLQDAIDRLAPSTPNIQTAPPVTVRHLVGIPTWLAVTADSWTSPTMTVTAGQAQATVALQPLHVTFDIGDGTQRTCDGFGARYDIGTAHHAQQPSCAHTFQYLPRQVSGNSNDVAFALDARITYRATFALDSFHGTQTGVLGTVTGPPGSSPLVVREYQAVRIGP